MGGVGSWRASERVRTGLGVASELLLEGEVGVPGWLNLAVWEVSRKALLPLQERSPLQSGLGRSGLAAANVPRRRATGQEHSTPGPGLTSLQKASCLGPFAHHPSPAPSEPVKSHVKGCLVDGPGEDAGWPEGKELTQMCLLYC